MSRSHSAGAKSSLTPNLAMSPGPRFGPSTITALQTRFEPKNPARMSWLSKP